MHLSNPDKYILFSLSYKYAIMLFITIFHVTGFSCLIFHWIYNFCQIHFLNKYIFILLFTNFSLRKIIIPHFFNLFFLFPFYLFNFLSISLFKFIQYFQINMIHLKTHSVSLMNEKKNCTLRLTDTINQ